MSEEKQSRKGRSSQRGVLGAFDAGAPELADTSSVAAIVVVPELTGAAAARENGSALRHAAADRLSEAEGLARAIDLNVAETILVRLSRLKPATLIGSGKIEELKALVGKHSASLLIVDHALAPIQQRNLEKQLGAKVIDRTGLILEIFGRRARTKEGQLQVELAALCDLGDRTEQRRGQAYLLPSARDVYLVFVMPAYHPLEHRSTATNWTWCCPAIVVVKRGKLAEQYTIGLLNRCTRCTTKQRHR